MILIQVLRLVENLSIFNHNYLISLRKIKNYIFIKEKDMHIFLFIVVISQYDLLQIKYKY